jgi:hypothetical protein
MPRPRHKRLHNRLLAIAHHHFLIVLPILFVLALGLWAATDNVWFVLPGFFVLFILWAVKTFYPDDRFMNPNFWEEE